MGFGSEQERVWHYYIDAEGHLWHEESEVDDPEILRFFMEKMEKLPDGKFRALCQGEECWFTAEDAPFVVQDLVVSPEKIELIFPGGYRESLDPSSLFVGPKNVLYCRLSGKKEIARFNRKTYLSLAQQISFDPVQKIFYVTLRQQRYPIQGVPRE